MGYTARRQQILLAILSVILPIFLLTFSACVCEPGSTLTIDNRTDQKLGIFIEEDWHGDAPPGEIKKFGTMEIMPHDSGDYLYLIEAKTEDGEVVYSEEFTWQELDNRDWIIVIPPPDTSS